MHDVLRFWLRRGVDGFRIDALQRLAHDPLLRDNAGAARRRDQDWETANDRVRGIRRVVEEFDDRMIVGEVALLDLPRVVSYLGAGDQLHLVHNFVFLELPWTPRRSGSRSTSSRRWPSTRPGRPGCRPATTTRVWRPATTATAADPRVRARWPCSSMGCAGRRSSTRARSSACPTRRSRPSASSTSTAATPSVRRSRGDRRRPPGRAPGSPAASRGCRSSPAPRTCASSARPPTHGPR